MIYYYYYVDCVGFNKIGLGRKQGAWDAEFWNSPVYQWVLYS